MSPREFSYVALPQSKAGHRVFYLFLLASFGFAFFSVAAERYRGVIALGAVACAAFALHFFLRYVAVEYTYSVFLSEEGEALLLVAQRTGKRVSTLCRVALADIVSIAEVLLYVSS